MIYMFLFFFLAGVEVAQRNVILVDILGVDKLPSSVALILVFKGIGTLIGPLFAGKIIITTTTSIFLKKIDEPSV